MEVSKNQCADADVFAARNLSATCGDAPKEPSAKVQSKIARDKELTAKRKQLTDYYFAAKNGDVELPTGVTLKKLHKIFFGGSRQGGSKFFRSRIRSHNE